MRIARFAAGGDPQYGIVELAEDGGKNPGTVAMLTGDPIAMPVQLTGERRPLADVRLLAPVIPRSKVVGVGKNYAAHAAEMGGDVPKTPLTFFKPNTSVIGPGDPIVLPRRQRAPQLRGRTRRGHRPDLPRCPRSARARGDLRLHRGQRRHRARPAAHRRAVGPGQGLRHVLPARPVDHHPPEPGRGRRSGDPDHASTTSCGRTVGPATWSSRSPTWWPTSPRTRRCCPAT